MFSVFPAFGSPVMDRVAGVPSQAYLAESRNQTGSGNVVEAILLGFRGLDTVGAVSVLFCAILGGLALLRKKARKKIEEPDVEVEVFEKTSTPAGMSLIVKTVTRWVKGLLLLYGIYLLLYGHSSPGGGFTGGVIFACALILVTMAEGQKNARTISKITAAGLACLGALLFLGMAVFSQTIAGHRFLVIQLSEIGIGLLVGSGLYLMFSYLSALHVRVKDGEREIVERRRD
jgi:multicomponent Na+:H+ antiporter subunit B